MFPCGVKGQRFYIWAAAAAAAAAATAAAAPADAAAAAIAAIVAAAAAAASASSWWQPRRPVVRPPPPRYRLDALPHEVQTLPPRALVAGRTSPALPSRNRQPTPHAMLWGAPCRRGQRQNPPPHCFERQSDHACVSAALPPPGPEKLCVFARVG